MNSGRVNWGGGERNGRTGKSNVFLSFRGKVQIETLSIKQLNWKYKFKYENYSYKLVEINIQIIYILNHQRAKRFFDTFFKYT